MDFCNYHLSMNVTIELSIEIVISNSSKTQLQIWVHKVEHLEIGHEATEVDNKAVGDATVATEVLHEAIDDHEAVDDDSEAIEFDDEAVGDAKVATEFAHEPFGDHEALGYDPEAIEVDNEP